jgi:hypothetical protein
MLAFATLSRRAFSERAELYGAIGPCGEQSSLYVYVHVYVRLASLPKRRGPCRRCRPARPMWVRCLAGCRHATRAPGRIGGVAAPARPGNNA